jgi:hypothetical protein
MKKTLIILTIGFTLITIVLSTGSCTKKVERPVAVQEENLTVVIGSISVDGDTTIYLQTIVRPK